MRSLSHKLKTINKSDLQKAVIKSTWNDEVVQPKSKHFKNCISNFSGKCKIDQCEIIYSQLMNITNKQWIFSTKLLSVTHACFLAESPSNLADYIAQGHNDLYQIRSQQQQYTQINSEFTSIEEFRKTLLHWKNPNPNDQSSYYLKNKGNFQSPEENLKNGNNSKNLKSSADSEKKINNKNSSNQDSLIQYLSVQLVMLYLDYILTRSKYHISLSNDRIGVLEEGIDKAEIMLAAVGIILNLIEKALENIFMERINEKFPFIKQVAIIILDDMLRLYNRVREYCSANVEYIFKLDSKLFIGLITRLYYLYSQMVTVTRKMRKIEFIKGLCRPLPIGIKLEFIYYTLSSENNKTIEQYFNNFIKTKDKQLSQSVEIEENKNNYNQTNNQQKPPIPLLSQQIESEQNSKLLLEQEQKQQIPVEQTTLQIEENSNKKEIKRKSKKIPKKQPSNQNENNKELNEKAQIIVESKNKDTEQQKDSVLQEEKNKIQLLDKHLQSQKEGYPQKEGNLIPKTIQQNENNNTFNNDHIEIDQGINDKFDQQRGKRKKHTFTSKISRTSNNNDSIKEGHSNLNLGPSFSNEQNINPIMPSNKDCFEPQQPLKQQQQLLSKQEMLGNQQLQKEEQQQQGQQKLSKQKQKQQQQLKEEEEEELFKYLQQQEKVIEDQKIIMQIEDSNEKMEANENHKDNSLVEQDEVEGGSDNNEVCKLDPNMFDDDSFTFDNPKQTQMKQTASKSNLEKPEIPSKCNQIIEQKVSEKQNDELFANCPTQNQQLQDQIEEDESGGQNQNDSHKKHNSELKQQSPSPSNTQDQFQEIDNSFEELLNSQLTTQKKNSIINLDPFLKTKFKTAQFLVTASTAKPKKKQ